MRCSDTAAMSRPSNRRRRHGDRSTADATSRAARPYAPLGDDETIEHRRAAGDRVVLPGSRDREPRFDLLALPVQARATIDRTFVDRAAWLVHERHGEPQVLAPSGQVGLVAEERVREHRDARVDRLVGRVDAVVRDEHVRLVEHGKLVDVIEHPHAGSVEAGTRVVVDRVVAEADHDLGVRCAEGLHQRPERGDGRLGEVPPDHRPERDVDATAARGTEHRRGGSVGPLLAKAAEEGKRARRQPGPPATGTPAAARRG